MKVDFVGKWVAPPVGGPSVEAGGWSGFPSNSRLCLCAQTQGRFIPSCDEDGYYRKQQCDRGECWCVDQNGGEVAGSRIRGKPDCGESGLAGVLF